MTIAIYSPHAQNCLHSAVLCSSAAKSDVTTSWLYLHLRVSVHTRGSLSCSSELTSVSLVSQNEMWGWYTILDENPDRDGDSTRVTKDIPPPPLPLCLTGRQWHNVAWNTVQPTLFSGGSAQAAKSLNFHLKIKKTTVTQASFQLWYLSKCVVLW